MSIAYKCDVCGELYCNGEKTKAVVIGERYGRRRKDLVNERWYDLCPKCYSKIKKLLINSQEKPALE